MICFLKRKIKLEGIRKTTFDNKKIYNNQISIKEKKITLLEDNILEMERNILKEKMNFIDQKDVLENKYKKTENIILEDFQNQIGEFENLIAKKKESLQEYDEFIIKKEVLINKNNELEEKLKFENEYIEKEKLKFCEEELIHQKLLNDEIKETSNIETNIKHVNKKLEDENKKYQNFYKQKNKYTKILMDLSKREKDKENININKQLFVNHNKILNEIEKKADKKLKYLLIKIENNQNILFNERKDHEFNKINIQKEIKLIKEVFFKNYLELKNKKKAIVSNKSNLEFIGKSLTHQRKIFLNFYQNCLQHFEEEIKFHRIKLKNQHNSEDEKTEILNSLENLHLKEEFLKKINLKFSK